MRRGYVGSSPSPLMCEKFLYFWATRPIAVTYWSVMVYSPYSEFYKRYKAMNSEPRNSKSPCHPCRLSRVYLAGIGWVDLVDDVIVESDKDWCIGMYPDEAVWRSE